MVENCCIFSTNAFEVKDFSKIIEHDPARCQELCEMLPNATIICGDGTDNTLLIEERIDQTDALVTLTNYDEENILLALFAQKRVKLKLCQNKSFTVN